MHTAAYIKARACYPCMTTHAWEHWQMKECKELIEESAKLLGRIDVLVNNAGDHPPQLIPHACAFAPTMHAQRQPVCMH